MHRHRLPTSAYLISARLGLAWPWLSRAAYQVQRGQHHAGGAEAALRGAAAQEAFLQRVHGLTGAHQAAQRGHLVARGLHGQGQAAVHRLAVQQHRAGAADALAAAVADVGQAELVVQDVEQGVRRHDPDLVVGPVDAEHDLPLVHGPSPVARAAAWRSARAVSTRTSRRR